MANIYDVAKLAGVSHTTVSRVINGKDKVRDKTRKNILSAMETLQYKPNVIATNLASRKSNSIGILVPSLTTQFFGELADEFEKTIRQNDLHMVLTTGQRDAEIEKEAIQLLQSRMCSVMVLILEDIPNEKLVPLLSGKEQIVTVGRKISGFDHSIIHPNDDDIERMATEYLIQSGHQKIARITGHRTIGHEASYVRERNKGYQETLEKSGIGFNPDLLVDSTFSSEGGYLGVKELLNRKCPFSAIIAGNDEMAVGVYSALHEEGLKIPEDVSIIGHDDSDFAQFMIPPLTSVKRQKNLGAVIGELCIALHKDPLQTLEKSIIPELQVRSSVSTIS